MPIIIWGSRGISSMVEEGDFYCPQCDAKRGYDLKKTTPYFTLYWIPLFPTGGASRYVECHTCGGTFKEAVLDMDGPSDEEREITDVLARIHKGLSLEDAEDDLVEIGLSRRKARDLVDEEAGARTWTCDTCEHTYAKGVTRCKACRDR